jgi:hypothetical protein
MLGCSAACLSTDLPLMAKAQFSFRIPPSSAISLWLFRVGAMHRFAFAHQGLAGAVFRIARLLRPFPSGVPVRVQRHPTDTQPSATLFKFSDANRHSP